MSQNKKVVPNTSQSDIDEIEDLIYASIQSGPTTVKPAGPLSPQTSIPVSTSPFMALNNPPTYQIPATVSVPPITFAETQPNPHHNVEVRGFGAASNTLTEPVWDTVKRDLNRIVSNLKLVVFPNPFREDPGKALRDWDLWGPFFFIVFLGLVLSWSASVKKSEVFAVAFGVLAAGAIILTLNVLLLVGCQGIVNCGVEFGLQLYLICARLHGPSWMNHFLKINRVEDPSQRKLTIVALNLYFILTFKLQAANSRGGHIIFFQSLSLLGYCLFPLDVGALFCMLKDSVIIKMVVVSITLAWSSWAAYPFMSAAVSPGRKALALYPVFLMYVSVGFLIIAID